MVLINDKHAIKNVAKLKELGIRLCMDDFGKGYSSLSYIKRFPIDVLKIDKSFVMTMLNDKVDLHICEMIIELARHLELELVAEGVETEAHAKKLLEIGCALFQGYYYSKAVPADAFEQLLHRLN